MARQVRFEQPEEQPAPKRAYSRRLLGSIILRCIAGLGSVATIAISVYGSIQYHYASLFIGAFVAVCIARPHIHTKTR